MFILIYLLCIYVYRMLSAPDETYHVIHYCTLYKCQPVHGLGMVGPIH